MLQHKTITWRQFEMTFVTLRNGTAVHYNNNNSVNNCNGALTFKLLTSVVLSW